MSDEAEHREWVCRRTGIGGSDAGAIMTRGAFEWWMRTTGRMPPIEETEPMRWGRRLERAILDGFEDDRLPDLFPGAKLVHQGIETIRMPAPDDWMCGTPDARIVRDGVTLGWVDAKHHDPFYAATFGADGQDADDALPLYHWTQGQHYTHLLGVEGFFAVLSGTGLRVYPVARSEVYARDTIPYLRSVWQHVLDDTPPPLDASDAARQYAVDACPAREETTDLSPEAEALAADVARWGEVEKDADTRKREASTRLLAALAGAKRGIGREWKVTRVDRAGDDRIDIKRLRAEMPEVVQRFTAPSKPTAYPLVKKIGG